MSDRYKDHESRMVSRSAESRITPKGVRSRIQKKSMPLAARIRRIIVLSTAAVTATTFLTIPDTVIAQDAWPQSNMSDTVLTTHDQQIVTIHSTWINTHNPSINTHIPSINTISTFQQTPTPPSRRIKDHFTDDEGHEHEHHINAIASRGITKGCNKDGTKYCPDEMITRAQAASFIARTMQLKPPENPTRVAFDDIAGNTHEDNIYAIAAVGIAKGCNENGTKYCPNDPLTGTQWANLMTRALDHKMSTDQTQTVPMNMAANINEHNNTTAYNIATTYNNTAAYNNATLYNASDSSCDPRGTNFARYCQFGKVTRAQIAQALATDTMFKS